MQLTDRGIALAGRTHVCMRESAELASGRVAPCRPLPLRVKTQKCLRFLYALRSRGRGFNSPATETSNKKATRTGWLFYLVAEAGTEPASALRAG